MAIDTKSLSDIISDFRALTAKDSITPESLGYILQRIADLLATAGTSETVAKIQTLLDGLKNAGQAIVSLEQGTADRNNILANLNVVNLSSGETTLTTDKIFIKQATTERAGAMRAQQVTDLNEARNNVRTLLTDVATLKTNLANLDDWVNQLETNLSAEIDSWGDDLYWTMMYELPHLTPIHIEVRNKVLHLSGHDSLIEQGYKPFLFRFCKKQNRHRSTSPQFHQKPVKGWRLMGREDVITLGNAGSVLFPTISHGDWHKITLLKAAGVQVSYSTDPANLINPHFDHDGNPVVSWGKTPVYTNDHKTKLPRMLRFRYAIAFATPDALNEKTVSPETLKSTFAEFSVIHTPDDTWAFSR